jgi:hypothetical protein
MRRRLLILICAALLAAVWWERHAERNVERAYFSSDGPGYLVEMKRWRFPLVHDPLSLLLGRTYEETLTMRLPRIEGVIDGTEIPVDADKLRYVGQVVITERKMKVDLYYGGDGENTRRPLPWNDEYTLVKRDGGDNAHGSR